MLCSDWGASWASSSASGLAFDRRLSSRSGPSSSTPLSFPLGILAVSLMTGLAVRDPACREGGAPGPRPRSSHGVIMRNRNNVGSVLALVLGSSLGMPAAALQVRGTGREEPERRPRERDARGRDRRSRPTIPRAEGPARPRRATRSHRTRVRRSYCRTCRTQDGSWGSHDPQGREPQGLRLRRPRMRGCAGRACALACTAIMRGKPLMA